jgi:hypothetical protein
MIRYTALLLALALSVTVVAQDRDTQEINRYVLTETALGKYANAMQKLQLLADQVASCEDEDSDGANSLNALVAQLDAAPAVKAAIQSAGLTTREWAVFTFAMAQTGLAVWMLDQPGGELPAGVSTANVDFYRKHRAAIEKIKPLEENCDAADGEPEYVE